MCPECQWTWKRLCGGKLGILESWAAGYIGTQRCAMDLGFLEHCRTRALPCGTNRDLGSVGSGQGVAAGVERQNQLQVSSRGTRELWLPLDSAPGVGNSSWN